MMTSYLTLAASACDEIVINKSRFIGYASPVSDEQEALEFLRSVKQKHKDATHHCYAYIIGTNSGIMRYSDDGEPGGTAGMPMIDFLKNKKLVNCIVVVVRYFGGVLLGTGGLVRAYTQGTKIAVEAAKIVSMELTCSEECDVPYSLWDKVRYEAESLPVQLTDIRFTSSVSFTLLVRSDDRERVLDTFTRVTDGRFESVPDESYFAAWEADPES